jgi:hypothetical protein
MQLLCGVGATYALVYRSLLLYFSARGRARNVLIGKSGGESLVLPRARKSKTKTPSVFLRGGIVAEQDKTATKGGVLNCSEQMYSSCINITTLVDMAYAPCRAIVDDEQMWHFHCTVAQRIGLHL